MTLSITQSLTQLWLLWCFAMLDTATAQPLFPAVLSLANLNETTGFRLDGEVAGDLSGGTVASAGDIDGIDDLIIGAYWAAPNRLGQAGSSYVVYGQSGGLVHPFTLASLTNATGFRIDGETVGDYSGKSVASAGDINGDGVDDLIIGAYQASPNGLREAGSSYVIYGQPGGLPHPFLLASLNGTMGFRIDGAAADHSGWSVASAGDINSDGMDDLIIGAHYATRNGELHAGSSYVVYGQKGGLVHPFSLASLTNATGFRIDGEAANDFCGWSVASAGDINGDDVGDIIIGAYLASPNGQRFAGSSYVIYGQPGGLPHPFSLTRLITSAGFRLDGEVTLDYSGSSVANAGDINGDGVNDIVIGANGVAPNSLSKAGSSYVVYGQLGGLPHPFSLASLTNATGFRINEGVSGGGISGSVSSAGDINGDGVDDLLIGAPNSAPNSLSKAGSSYVVYGQLGALPHPFSLGSLTNVTGFRIDGVAQGDFSGRAVANAGDINGDGVNDIVIGADGADPNRQGSAGSSYVVYGRRQHISHSPSSSTDIIPQTTTALGSTKTLPLRTSVVSQTTATSNRTTTTTQQLLSTVLGTAKPEVSASDSSNTAILVGSIVGGLALTGGLAAFGIFACRRKAKQKPNNQQAPVGTAMTTPASASPSSNNYDLLPTRKPVEYSHYADPRNIPQQTESHYLEGEEARAVLDELAQDFAAEEARHNGYGDITQARPAGTSW